MILYLIGFSGCGKSTIAQKLSKHYRFKLIDIDEFIENKYNRSIDDIFNDHGEAIFRQYEHNAILWTTTLNNCVVATGGGLPCFNNNIKIMNLHGITIYINVSVEVLKTRLENEQIHRPLIKGKTGDILKDFINSELLKRQKYYKMAKIIYNAEHDSIEELINKIDTINA